MTGTSRVLWSEGLFLRPQHFQQQDRHAEALVRGALAAGRLQTCGFTELALDAALLEAGRVAVASAAGIFPDGTPFAIPETMDPPEPVAIARDAPRGPVRLALPLEAPGGAAFDPAHGEPSGARYRGRIERVRDAVHGGAEPEEIEIARPQARLLAPGAPDGGYTTLCRRRGDGAARRWRRRAAESFLPPALATRATPFYAQLLQELITGLDRIADAHGRMVLGGPGRSVENLLVLELANTARPRLAHMLAQDLFHPRSSISSSRASPGRMATYGSGSRRLTDLPAYDHLAPGPPSRR
jgi:type VI secretion system protein ImpJ